jgi:phosphoglycolate phosphatase-like HAD superfamily hydrolase
VWDLPGARRCHALGLGLKSGRGGEEELQRAAAIRVYENPAGLLDYLNDLAMDP